MNDVVIVAGVRSAVGAFGKSLKNVSATEMGRQVLEGLMQKSSLSKDYVDEVIFGHGYVHGTGLNAARVSSQLANFPITTPGHIVIKACGSGLKAITNGALAIMAGQEDVIIAGGVENMSNVPYVVKNRWGSKFGHVEMEDALLSDGLICSLEKEHMGCTAETLAKRYGISREDQDRYAYDSHIKASAAIREGRFKDEIVPLEIKSRKGIVVFDTDESVREDIDLTALKSLKPMFQKDGDVTAGNSCPMNDGASALLLMSEDKATQYNLKPLVKIKAFASVGVDPAVMGIGPVPATRKALKKAGLTLDDIGLIELNEAFAAQSLAVIRELNLDPAKVNVNGGAIALGHPVGATGGKLTVTLIHEMLRTGVKYGMVTLCMAGGMGLTVIYENMQV